MTDQIKKKRISTRIGDIFCIQLKGRKTYFQFIAVDASELNSTTIRVFKKKYPLDYAFNAEEVVSDEIFFYAHTCLLAGLKQGLWAKIGKSKDIGDLSKVLFRNTDAWAPDHLKSYKWWVGGINGKYTMIGELTQEYKIKTHMGWVVPPIDIIKKIEFGEYQRVMPY